MATELITTLLIRLADVPRRLQRVVAAYLLALMIEAPRHSQTLAATMSGISQSQFSRLLTDHGLLARNTLIKLGVSFAKAVASGREPLVKGASWTIAIIVDATLHPRSSLKVHNAQRFNHGDGFVIGHQWTNVVIYVGQRLIPLPPIPFWSRRECKRRHVPYRTEHERLRDYLANLNLAAYIGQYLDSEVVVMMDAGYDNKRLQNAVLAKGWDFLVALKSCRGARGQWEQLSYGKKRTWRRVDDLFRDLRGQSPWTTVRIKTDGGKKRREFRARILNACIKGVSRPVALVCSEKSRGKGRRYFACSSSLLDRGVILRAYSLRWNVEIFHRITKHQLGLLDAGVEQFDALESHALWVYCAWIMLHELDLEGAGLLEKQRRLTSLANRQPMTACLRRILNAKRQFGGRERQEALLRAALEDSMAA